MTLLFTNGFVIVLCGLYVFFCAYFGIRLGANQIADKITKKMYKNIDSIISEEEKSIKRTNI